MRILPKMASGERSGRRPGQTGIRQRPGVAEIHRHKGGRRLETQRPRRSGFTGAVRRPWVRPVRSDPEAQRHKGLTYFMFDLKADGITVRPIAQLGGDTGFGEIFLDDVFVPDQDVIGTPTTAGGPP